MNSISWPSPFKKRKGLKVVNLNGFCHLPARLKCWSRKGPLPKQKVGFTTGMPSFSAHKTKCLCVYISNQIKTYKVKINIKWNGKQTQTQKIGFFSYLFSKPIGWQVSVSLFCPNENGCYTVSILFSLQCMQAIFHLKKFSTDSSEPWIEVGEPACWHLGNSWFEK